MGKKRLGRKVMGIFLGFISVLIGLFLVIVIGGTITQNFVYTPPFKGADGKVLPGSIAEFRRVKLGGYSQAILIRGKSIDNPMMIFLHAGPGLSETGMFRNMNSVLEDYFTIVYLDQRGAGKSYSPWMDYKTMNTEQLVQDIHELTLYLKKRFGKEKIAIMGHSFGAGFGTYTAAKYPDDYSAYIGIGQPVCPCDIDRISYGWTVEQACKKGNDKALKELEAANGYWLQREPKKYFQGMMTNKKWVGYYGGQMYGRKGFVSFVFANLLCNEYTVFDYAPYMLGMTFSGPASFEIMVTTDFRKQAPEFQCPFILLTGRRDYNVVPALVEEYYTMVKAPLKRQYWFENSAHLLLFEERELFQKVMIEEVLPIVKGN